MIGRLFKRVVLAVSMAVIAAISLEVQAGVTVGDGKIVYSDVYIRIEITGGWESATENNGTITFHYPASTRVKVRCRSVPEGWVVDYTDVDERVKGGYVKCTVKCKYNEEESHTVKLYFQSEGEVDIDLDCDADWDGDIDEEDDPIEDTIGGLVGLDKTAPLKLSLVHEESYPKGGELTFSVRGGIVLCKDQEGAIVIAENPNPGHTTRVTVDADDIQGTYYVKGVVASTHFNDCKVIASYTLPGGASAKDAVGFTVVTVDVAIDGQGEDEEEVEGAYALFVDDFNESPYAPRATNYLKKVEMWIYPKDFPEDLQTNIWIDVTGSRDHLFEKIPMAATWGKALYSPATNRYTMADLKKQDSADEHPYFGLHGHTQSTALRDRSLQIKEPKTTVEDEGLFTVIKLNVVPDYDRDHVIGGKDEKQLCMDKKFYWWNNDDHDLGDCASMFKDHGTEIHGEGMEYTRIEKWLYVSEKPNCQDKKVNGKTDLLDFFPMWLDAHEMFKLLKGEEVSLEMLFPGLGIVGTKLGKGGAGRFLTVTCYTSDGRVELCNAEVDNSGKTDFSNMKEFIDSVKNNSTSGILMTEGAGGGNITLNLIKKDKVSGQKKTVLCSVTPMSMRDVRAFYNEVSLYDGETRLIQERADDMDELFSEKKDVFSLHGFKVDATHADGWHSEFFKRLYQSQSYARFWGVTWDGAQTVGSDNPGKYYHQDAAHAFKAAKLLKVFVDDQRHAGKLKGEVSMMAHSLGNMVVSAAVSLEGMKIDRYLMLDAAVPVEAYDGEKDDDRMINSEWKAYPKISFCSKWYQLFGLAPDVEEGGKLTRDARKDLKWPDLFKDLTCTTYNYYSEGDEVFELADDIWWLSGFRPVMDGYYDVSRHSWQLQEIAKGVDSLANVIVDNNPSEGIVGHSGGWGFHNTIIEERVIGNIIHKKAVRVYDSAQTAAASPTALMRVPVFAHSPQWTYEWSRYNNKLTRERKTGLLCHVVPAMSEAAGRCEVGGKVANRNLDSDDYRNNWGRNDGTYNTRWLHCDLKDMAYYYNHPAWVAIVGDGNFMKEK